MIKRLSSVNNVNIKEVAFSAVFEVGDSETIDSFSRALAVQREARIFYGKEGNFDAYPLFSQPLPKPVFTEELTINRINDEPTIHVNSVNITGMSFSSVFQIGSTRSVNTEARVKHVRQLLGNAKSKGEQFSRAHIYY